LSPSQIKLANRRWQVYDGEIPTSQTHLTNRTWPKAYSLSWTAYPEVYQFGVMVAARDRLDRVGDWLREPSKHEEALAGAILALMKIDPARGRDIALRAARAPAGPFLRLTAFRTLDAYHDDEVDQLFIDELVANDDRSDPVRQIADRRWAEV